MHKFYEFACKELKELENKMDKGLSSTELEYANKLLEMKKNILKIEMLEDSGYSADEMHIPEYTRRANRHSRDYMHSRLGYSRDQEEIIDQLEDMQETAPDEWTRKELSKLIRTMRGR